MIEAMERLESNEVSKPSKILQEIRVDRAHFNPADKNDQAIYLIFMTQGRWIKKYAIEWPSTTVPATIERKLLEHFLKPVLPLAHKLTAANSPLAIVKS